MKESELIKLVGDYLTAKRYFWYRQNSGALKTERGGFVRFGTSGAPDIVIVIDGKYIGCELKVGKNKLSESQFAFGERLVKSGGRYEIIRSIEDLQTLLTQLKS